MLLLLIPIPEITHPILLPISFIEGDPASYTYRGIAKHLDEQGGYRLHGFSQPIHRLNDLAFMCRLIDLGEGD